ncbi:hypothetical protein EVJ58_g5352 [Rhodofomes roseus]|uniref:Protein kinase domain-containing protein n=1 Tax=Rhodofomes roseus TaxID=34475 RepID=A0A4Y9YC58_9APHY|nr:hypothetical protein EVJ58_g5352 [Rhodofomes roseus]
MTAEQTTPGITDSAQVTQADHIRGGLRKHEYIWRDRQPWLQERGYVLRSRYRPDWTPSWIGTGRHHKDCEDGYNTLVPSIIDGTRKSDGLLVTLKAVDTSVHPFEVEIGQFLSSEPLANNPRNHCVRILDVLQDPNALNVTILVMPLLKRYDIPEYTTVGEVVAFCKQAIEGLHFMHDHHVAHRDISILNVMMDAIPLYSKGLWHPRAARMTRDFSGVAKHVSRTERPVRYFYIDFGLSRKYNSADGPPRELPILGGDKSVPEFQEHGYNVASDPFRTDIYYLGNLFRITFLNHYRSFEFMEPLVADMVQADPENRPTIAEVESRFDEATRHLSSWKLRGRLVHKDENAFVRGVLDSLHFFTKVPFVMDATRISDSSIVLMKKLDAEIHPFELEIGQFLSSDQITSDPRSHCVRILEVLPDPMEQSISLIVMPYLRAFDNPEFLTFGEAVACFKQLIEGLRVMHENNVAHRCDPQIRSHTQFHEYLPLISDISKRNVMMDAAAMYPDMWHPRSPADKYDYSGKAKYYTRTERPPKYYYIDFGLSRKYDPDNTSPEELPILGGDKSVPEFQGRGYDKPANPFHTDIYYLGNLMRTKFVAYYRGFEFMHPLVADMLQSDPAKRPSIAEVETRFDEAFRGLTKRKLRSRLVRKDEIMLERAIYGTAHVFRTVKYLVKRLPPVPTPPL